jgi:ribose 5-phosphate isomerase B
MKVAIASDHAGYDMKEALLAFTRGLGHEILDLGPHRLMPEDDYPDFAEAIGVAVAKGQTERGILICGSGVGASVAVNKIPGIRGGICHDSYSAHQGVEHDNMNVLVLGSRVIGPQLAEDLVRIFLAASFTGEERHRRRLEKIRVLEMKHQKS